MIELFGKEYGLKMTMGATFKICDLLDTTNIGDVFKLLEDVGDINTMQTVFKVAQFMNEGYNKVAMLEDPKAELPSLNDVDFDLVEVPQMTQILVGIMSAATGDLQTTVEIEPVEDGKKTAN